MTPPKKIIISLAIVIICLLTFFLSRSVPVSQLWKGYSLVYVKSEELSESQILNLFYQNGCSSIISKSTQNIPIYSPFAPVQVQNSDSYIFRRNGFFSDPTNSFRVFYVPENQLGKALKVVNILNESLKAQASTDSARTFPWIAPFFVLIFACALVYFSSNKIMFLTSAFSVLFFAFTRPFYTVCAACLMLLFAFFIAQKIYGRRGILNDKKNSFYIILCVAFPLIFLVFSSLISATLYLLCVISSISAIFAFKEIQGSFINKKSSFDFVYIKSSSSVKTIEKTSLKLLICLTCAILIFILINVFSVNVSASFSLSERPLLPSPVAQSSYKGELPSVKDFSDWSWQTLSFPYKKLSPSPLNSSYGESVYIDDFFVDSNGFISEKQKKVLTYDSSFLSTIYDKVNKLDYPAIEKLMLKQGKNSCFGYTKTAGSAKEKSAVLVLSVFAIVPLMIFLKHFLGKKKQWL